MKTVLVLSGGLDSTTLAYFLVKQGHEVTAVMFYYGQRHAKELDCAVQTCFKLELKHEVITLPDFLFSGSALVEDGKDLAPIKNTIVPARNMVFLSIAVSKALQWDCSRVAFGALKGSQYTDCRPEYVSDMNDVAEHHGVRITAPFIHYSKADIIQMAHRLGVPEEDTWSCYAGGETPCGVCGSCKTMEAARQEIAERSKYA